MRDIKLADYNPPPLDQRRYFTLDSVSGAYRNMHAYTPEEIMKFTAGWGSIVPIEGHKSDLAAIYLDHDSIMLRIGDLVTQLSEGTTAAVKSDGSAAKTFTLNQGTKIVAEVKYKHPVDRSDTDLLEFVQALLKDSFGLRKFAYAWSATRIGKKRPVPSVGLTDELVQQIVNPYDVEHNVGL